jgi:hypothetical protein
VYKIILNSSYGKDGMNTAKYSNITAQNRNETLFKQTKPTFLNTRMVGRDLFLVQSSKIYYKIETPIQCACATLDNAKYWYLNFIYNFMMQCLNMDKLHFIEGDTDSMYWAVAGDEDLDYHQGFEGVVIDWGEYTYQLLKWFPDKSKGLKDEKKLLGLCVEKEGTEMIALGPKCYTIKAYEKDS